MALLRLELDGSQPRPMERHAAEAARLSDCNTETLAARSRGEKVSICGMVMDLTERTTRNGKRLGIFALEDLLGRAEVVVYAEKLGEYSELLKTDDPIFVSGSVRIDDRGDAETRGVILDEVLPMGSVRARRTREIHLHVDAAWFNREGMVALKAVLEGHPGRCDAFIEIGIPDRSVTTVDLPEEYRLAPSDELLIALEGLSGLTRVEFR